jgi:hypothetical protein
MSATPELGANGAQQVGLMHLGSYEGRRLGRTAAVALDAPFAEETRALPPRDAVAQRLLTPSYAEGAAST